MRPSCMLPFLYSMHFLRCHKVLLFLQLPRACFSNLHRLLTPASHALLPPWHVTLPGRYFDPTLYNPCRGGDLNVRMQKNLNSKSNWDYIRYFSQCERTPAGSVCCNSNCSSGAECIFLPTSAYPIVIAGWVFTSICALITLNFISKCIKKRKQNNAA